MRSGLYEQSAVALCHDCRSPMLGGAGWRELSIIDESKDSLVGRVPMTRYESWCEIKPVPRSAL
jgi:hypothetical protein